MSTGRTAAFICACLILLGVLAWLFPQEGVTVGCFELKFPSLEEVLLGKSGHEPVMEEMPPEEQLQRMSQLFNPENLHERNDSSAYFESFFDSSAVRIEFPGNNPALWDRLFATLEEERSAGGPMRIIHYGDSQIEQDRITSSLRDFFTSIFGGSGIGAVPVVQTVQNPYFVQTSEGNWQRFAVFGPLELRHEEERYGPLGSMAVVRDSAYVVMENKRGKKSVRHFSNLKVLMGHNSAGFSVTLTIGDISSVQTVADSMRFLTELNWHLSSPAEYFILSFRGNAEIYGIMMDGAQGVAVDNVPMRGSSGTFFTGMDADLLRQSYKMMNVKMILMEYGGNTMPAVRSEKDVENYVRGIGWQIRFLKRIAPDIPVLFIGPADMATTIDGQVATYPLLEAMVDSLQKVCLEQGAAFWNMYRVMGGRNSMVEWASSDPPLAASDYVHFTLRGAQRMGELLDSTLSVCYSYYRFRKNHPNDSFEASACRLKTEESDDKPLQNDGDDNGL